MPHKPPYRIVSWRHSCRAPAPAAPACTGRACTSASTGRAEPAQSLRAALRQNFIPEGMTIQDFGVSYDELEPFFDQAEKVFGTSGSAWSIKGKVVGKERRQPVCAGSLQRLPAAGAEAHWSAQLFARRRNRWAITLTICRRPTPPVLHQYLRRADGPVQLLRLLQRLRLLHVLKASPNVNILPALRRSRSLSCATTRMCCASILPTIKTRDRSDLSGRSGT